MPTYEAPPEDPVPAGTVTITFRGPEIAGADAPSDVTAVSGPISG